MKIFNTVWRALLKWSSWVIWDMTLELSLAVWVELAVLWNYYGLVQLMSDEVVTCWTGVTRAADWQWSTWCHACRQKVTPTGLSFWYLLKQNRVFWLLMRAVLNLKNIVSIKALWERNHTYADILEKKSLRLGKSGKTERKDQYLEIIRREGIIVKTFQYLELNGLIFAEMLDLWCLELITTDNFFNPYGCFNEQAIIFS